MLFPESHYQGRGVRGWQVWIERVAKAGPNCTRKTLMSCQV